MNQPTNQPTNRHMQAGAAAATDDNHVVGPIVTVTEGASHPNQPVNQPTNRPTDTYRLGQLLPLTTSTSWALPSP